MLRTPLIADRPEPYLDQREPRQSVTTPLRPNRQLSTGWRMVESAMLVSECHPAALTAVHLIVTHTPEGGRKAYKHLELCVPVGGLNCYSARDVLELAELLRRAAERSDDTPGEQRFF